MVLPAVFEFLEYGKLKRTNWILILLAPLAHYSIVAIYPALFLNRVNKKIAIIIGILISFILLRIMAGIDSENIQEFIPNPLWLDDRIRGYFLQISLNDAGNKLNLISGANLIYLYYLIAMRVAANYFAEDVKRSQLFIVNERMVVFSFIIYVVLINYPVLATRISELFRVLTPFSMSLMFAGLCKKNKLSLLYGIVMICSAVLLNILLYGPVIIPINALVLMPLGIGRTL